MDVRLPPGLAATTVAASTTKRPARYEGSSPPLRQPRAPRGGDLELNLKDAFLHRNYSYKDCPIVEPNNWGGGSLRSITAPFKSKALLKTRKRITITNKWSGFDETVLAGGLASAETTYKLKLKPLN